MKFLVLCALVASARAFSYTTGTVHPAGLFHYGGAYRSLAVPSVYAHANHGYGYNYAYNTPSIYKSYAATPAGFNYGVNVAHTAHVAAPVVAAAPVLKAAPVAVAAAPVAVAAPTYYNHASYAPGTAQYRQQNELGEYKFGYSGDTSSRDEIRTADGVVQGQYSYLDANNIPQQVNYVADALGFRVAATNLPVDTNTPVAAAAPAVVHAAVAPAVVHHAAPILKAAHVVDTINPDVPYTPEVAHARANHLAALAEATHAAVHTIHKRDTRYNSYGRRSYGRHSYGSARSYNRSYSNGARAYGRRSYGRY